MHSVDEEITTLEQQLLEVHDEKQRVRILCDLVANYDKKFLETEDLSDRQTAINYGFEVLASIPEHDSRRPGFFEALIAMQHSVIFNSPNPPDLVELEAAISFTEVALESMNGIYDDTKTLKRRSDFLSLSFDLSEKNKAIDDLNECIALSSTVLQRWHRNPDISCVVAQRLLRRYSVTGDYWDVELAVRYCEDALTDHRENPDLLEILSDALQARHLITKSHRDLDEAIARLETALALPHLRRQYRSTLEEKLEAAKELHDTRTDSGSVQSLEDLTATITLLSKNAESAQDQSSVQCLIKLARLCTLKMARTQDPNDLEIAVEYTLQAVKQSPPGHPQTIALVIQLGKLWKQQGNLTDDENHQQKCRRLARQAFLSAAEVPSQPPLERLQNLRAVAELSIEQEDWDTSSWCLRRAMEMLPLIASHTLLLEDMEFVLRSVGGIAALAASSYLAGGHACPHNALAEIELGRGMIFSLITDTRMDISSLRDKHPGLYAEYEALRKGVSAISNHTQVLPMEDILAAIEAAGIQVPAGDDWRVQNTPGVQRLEGLASTLLALPSPGEPADGQTEDFDSTQRPESFSTCLDTTQRLAAKQKRPVRKDLKVTQDANGKIVVKILKDDSQPEINLQDILPGVAASIHYEYAMRLSKLENRIRQTEGFNNFKERRSLAYFKRNAEAGPVVSFNITTLRSDAFIVTKGNVMAMRMDPQLLGYDIVQEQAKFISGPGSVLVERDGGLTLAQRNRKLGEVLKWLWDAAVKPVLQELSLLQSKRGTPPAVLPRIWWVASGILGQFPFHAAGHKWRNSLENTLAHVVSSYTPTIRALEYAREKVACASAAASVSDPSKALIIAMPRTSGMSELTNVDPETETIAKLLGCERVRHPSKADVMHKLEHSNLIHFGCHGEADPFHPRKSCLFVAIDGDRTPECITVEDLIRTNLPNAQLAYLSACSTAQNKVTELNEEMLHLASVFQLIGFPQVIGTLWETKDWAANRVALNFYKRVAETMTDGWHHTDKFALFLHEAVTETREGGLTGKRDASDNLLAWVPFVHMGC